MSFSRVLFISHNARSRNNSSHDATSISPDQYDSPAPIINETDHAHPLKMVEKGAWMFLCPRVSSKSRAGNTQSLPLSSNPTSTNDAFPILPWCSKHKFLTATHHFKVVNLVQVSSVKRRSAMLPSCHSHVNNFLSIVFQSCGSGVWFVRSQL